jgi:hypothetical protein
MREGLPNRGNDLKCMVGWVGTKQLAACSRYNVPTLFRNLLKRSLESVAFTKHATHYG